MAPAYILYGCGRIGKVWRELVGEENVVAVVERELNPEDPKVVTELTPELAARANGVIVCTPTHLHPAHVTRCIELGLPTLCEKPLSTDPAEIARVFDFARERAVSLVVGMNRRWDPLVDSLRPAQQLSIECKDYPEPSEAFLLQSGGVFQDCLIHELDIAAWATKLDLAGEPIELEGLPEEDSLPPSTLLKRATVRIGDRFKVSFDRQSDRYIHRMTVDGVLFRLDGIKHSGFMDRFRTAFASLKDTMDRVVSGEVSVNDLKRIPTKEQCVALCELANRIDDAYATRAA